MIYRSEAVNYVNLFYTRQALTNQLLSNVGSRTPVLQYLFVNVPPYQNIFTCWWSRKYLTGFFIRIVSWISRVYLLEILTFSRMCSFLKCTCIPHKRKTFWQLILPSVEIQTFLLIKNWPSFFQGHLNAPLEKKISWENKRIWGKSFCNCLLKLCRRNFRFFRKK